MDIMTSSAGHTWNVNDIDEAQRAGGTRNDESTEGKVHHTFGSIEDKQARQFFDFMEKYHHGRKEEDGGVFQLVLLNLPSSLQVYGLKKHVQGALENDEEVPCWNVMREHFIQHGLTLASKMMSKCGWVVCIHTLEQSKEVEDAAFETNLVPHSTLTLQCNLPIYVQLPEPKEKVHLLFITIFKHSDREQSSEINEEFFPRDVILEEMHKRQWVYRNDKAYRAGAQRSTKMWQDLILAFTKSGDSVADLTASRGTGEFVSSARQLERHALALEEKLGGQSYNIIRSSVSY